VWLLELFKHKIVNNLAKLETFPEKSELKSASRREIWRNGEIKAIEQDMGALENELLMTFSPASKFYLHAQFSGHATFSV
jgi:hypothetical protein